MSFISITEQARVPKYRQIIASVEDAVKAGTLKKNDRLPSINKVCMAHGLSRDTVLLAYENLKKRGIVHAIPGKGYYLESLEVGITEKIFLLFDELNSFKEDLYNAFLEHMGDNVQVEIFFHHFNIRVFEKLIAEADGQYTRYIIMPTNLPGAANAIRTLPVGEVIILDQTNDDLAAYPAIYQNFVKDMALGLEKGRALLDKYEKLILIFPGFREPAGMREGFEKFCAGSGFRGEVIPEFGYRKVSPGEVYIIPNDRDLVSVIGQSRQQGLRLGTDFGIISYNETPLKKVVEGGITTLSTDFAEMGRQLADIVRHNRKKQIENRSGLIVRQSL